MRGTKAKRIRKTVYAETDYRDRNYYKDNGKIVADNKRQDYQQRKKQCR